MEADARHPWTPRREPSARVLQRAGAESAGEQAPHAHVAERLGALGEDPLLEGEGVPVADPAQPADPEWSRPVWRHVHPATKTWTA